MPGAGTASTIERATSVAPVLCVDLDGTLLASDLLAENLLAYLKLNPLGILLLPLWLLRGRAYLKERLAQSASFAVELLPYRGEVLEQIAALKRRGATRVVLATASHEALAQRVASHLGIFDEVLASDGRRNLKGREKARVLRERFGNDFLYMGDSSADLAVWAEARQGVVVGSERLAREAAKCTELVAVVPTERAGVQTFWRALRPHHWSKNVLLLLPLLLAHRVAAPVLWLHALSAMLLFGLGASSIYVLNDLLDLTSDRRHPWKRLRPFAAGRISIAHGATLGAGLLAGSVIGGGLVLGVRFALMLLGYCGISLAYSLVLKRKALIDVFVLTSFYGIRIVTGSVVTHTPLSHWFLVFSMFFFFSLALAKRYSELRHAQELVDAGISGRGYRTEDAPLLAIMGVASAFASVVVFSFYTNSPEVAHLYPHPAPLLLVAPMLLYWMVRIWLQAGRGELKDDPVTLAMRDPVSYWVGLGSALCILLTFLWR